MKGLLGIALAIASTTAFASGGPIDGIYSCTVSGIPGASQSYVALNGQADGSTIFTVAAVTPSTYLYGYGMGQVSGSTFSGQTMFNAPFNFSINGTSFSGQIGVVIGGTVLNASVSCSKIW